MINPKFNICGLGVPTRWHVSLQNDFTTKEEAEAFQEFLQGCVEMAERLDKELKKYNELVQVTNGRSSPANFEVHSAWVGTLDCLQHIKFGDDGI